MKGNCFRFAKMHSYSMHLYLFLDPSVFWICKVLVSLTYIQTFPDCKYHHNVLLATLKPKPDAYLKYIQSKSNYAKRITLWVLWFHFSSCMICIFPPDFLPSPFTRYFIVMVDITSPIFGAKSLSINILTIQKKRSQTVMIWHHRMEIWWNHNIFW